MILILLSMLVASGGAAGGALRVLGGRDASDDAYPYVVSVETLVTFQHVDKSFHQCTGAALAVTWTLTVAHCIQRLQEITTNMARKTFDKWRHVIRQGYIAHIEMTNDNYRAILSLISHPSFNIFKIKEKIVKLENDIGLLRTEPITMKLYGRLSSVDYSAIFGTQAYAVGYGEMNHTRGDSTVETTIGLKKPLQVLDVLITKCGKDYQFIHPVICTARLCNQFGALCSGDTGGPLVYRGAIVGVNILGADCAKLVGKRDRTQDRKLAGSMTPVSIYLDWLVNTMKRMKT